MKLNGNAQNNNFSQQPKNGINQSDRLLGCMPPPPQRCMPPSPSSSASNPPSLSQFERDKDWDTLSVATSGGLPALSVYENEEEKFRREIILGKEKPSEFMLKIRCKTCTICGAQKDFIFNTMKESLDHLRKRHYQKRCPKCFLCFTSNGNIFKNHLEQHFVKSKSRPEHIQCAYCPKHCHHEDLWDHMDSVHFSNDDKAYPDEKSSIEDSSSDFDISDVSSSFTCKNLLPTDPNLFQDAFLAAKADKINLFTSENVLELCLGGISSLNGIPDLISSKMCPAETGSTKRKYFTEEQKCILIQAFLDDPNPPWEGRAKYLTEILLCDKQRILKWLSKMRTKFLSENFPKWAKSDMGLPTYKSYLLPSNKLHIVSSTRRADMPSQNSSNFNEPPVFTFVEGTSDEIDSLSFNTFTEKESQTVFTELRKEGAEFESSSMKTSSIVKSPPLTCHVKENERNELKNAKNEGQPERDCSITIENISTEKYIKAKEGNIQYLTSSKEKLESTSKYNSERTTAVKTKVAKKIFEKPENEENISDAGIKISNIVQVKVEEIISLNRKMGRMIRQEMVDAEYSGYDSDDTCVTQPIIFPRNVPKVPCNSSPKRRNSSADETTKIAIKPEGERKVSEVSVKDQKAKKVPGCLVQRRNTDDIKVEIKDEKDLCGYESDDTCVTQRVQLPARKNPRINHDTNREANNRLGRTAHENEAIKTKSKMTPQRRNSIDPETGIKIEKEIQGESCGYESDDTCITQMIPIRRPKQQHKNSSSEEAMVKTEKCNDEESYLARKGKRKSFESEKEEKPLTMVTKTVDCKIPVAERITPADGIPSKTIAGGVRLQPHINSRSLSRENHLDVEIKEKLFENQLVARKRKFSEGNYEDSRKAYTSSSMASSISLSTDFAEADDIPISNNSNSEACRKVTSVELSKNLSWNKSRTPNELKKNERKIENRERGKSSKSKIADPIDSIKKFKIPKLSKAPTVSKLKKSNNRPENCAMKSSSSSFANNINREPKPNSSQRYNDQMSQQKRRTSCNVVKPGEFRVPNAPSMSPTSYIDNPLVERQENTNLSLTSSEGGQRHTSLEESPRRRKRRKIPIGQMLAPPSKTQELKRELIKRKQQVEREKQEKKLLEELEKQKQERVKQLTRLEMQSKWAKIKYNLGS